MTTRPQIVDLERLSSWWSDEEVEAFFLCVRSDDSTEVPASREKLISGSVKELFWAYNSRVRARAAESTAKAKIGAYDYMPKPLKEQILPPTPLKPLHEYATPLSYEMLLRECCKKLKIERSDVESSRVLEVYLYEKVMILAVAAMTAEQRHAFLTRPVHLDGLAMSFPNTGMKGATNTLAALGAAQASGFGVYLGATTALGFVSHAIGVTLPFAIYAGMSSTIAFIIGPIGFLTAGAWLGWSATGPEWTRILRGLLHVVAMRAKYEYRLASPALHDDSSGVH
jgi:uncharacterized protein YaaW (UPF0174 family)